MNVPIDYIQRNANAKKKTLNILGYWFVAFTWRPSIHTIVGMQFWIFGCPHVPTDWYIRTQSFLEKIQTLLSVFSSMWAVL